MIAFFFYKCNLEQMQTIISFDSLPIYNNKVQIYCSPVGQGLRALLWRILQDFLYSILRIFSPSLQMHVKGMARGVLLKKPSKKNEIKTEKKGFKGVRKRERECLFIISVFVQKCPSKYGENEAKIRTKVKAERKRILGTWMCRNF